MKMVEDAFSERTNSISDEIGSEVQSIVKKIGSEIQNDAELFFNNNPGAKLDQYIDSVRDRDYRSEVLEKLTGFVQEKKEISLSYKPNMGYEHVWNKFMDLTKSKNDGIISRDILRHIIEEEKAQGRTPDEINIETTIGKYSPTVGMVLGQLKSSGKPIEKIGEKWFFKAYDKTLTKVLVDDIITGTLIAAEKAEEDGSHRWKVEDVIKYSKNRNLTQDMIEAFYEIRLNGKTVRGEEGIGMTIIENPKTKKSESVYFWLGGKGDFTQTKNLVYKTIAGQVCTSDEQERDVRSTYKDSNRQSSLS
jgi:hypothetical protein